MQKTTLYLPDDVKAAVEVEARRSGRSEAEVIRSAVAAAVKPVRPKPRAGLFSGEPIARRVDDLLEGFGEP
jgi:plasmid stability protein